MSLKGRYEEMNSDGRKHHPQPGISFGLFLASHFKLTLTTCIQFKSYQNQPENSKLKKIKHCDTWS